jgi:hypothetical protein
MPAKLTHGELRPCDSEQSDAVLRDRAHDRNSAPGFTPLHTSLGSAPQVQLTTNPHKLVLE